MAEIRRMDLGDDPLDPHGDGTIREGDPVYETMMKSLQQGGSGAFLANRNEDGTWDVEMDDPTVDGDDDTDDLPEEVEDAMMSSPVPTAAQTKAVGVIVVVLILLVIGALTALTMILG